MTQPTKFIRISILATLTAALLFALPIGQSEACGYSPRDSAMYAISDFYGGTLERVEPTEEVPVVKMLSFSQTEKGGVALVEINHGTEPVLEFVTLKRKGYSEMIVSDVEDAPRATRALLKWLEPGRRS